MIKCPLCKNTTAIKLIEAEKVIYCPVCGAYKDINQYSGNIVWMKNGRIVFAAEDLKDRKKNFERHGYDESN